MSHQAGIKACDELKKFFAFSKSDDVRLMKIGIKNEQLVLDDSVNAESTWDKDWDSMILPRLEKSQPSYIIFRLDQKNESGYQWIFISYSPDSSPVREKMFYAATKATLRNEFGQSNILHEVFGTVPTDVNLAGYKKHVVSALAPQPLTFAEEELQHIKKTEVNSDISVDSKHQTVQGIAFPLSDDALYQLNLFKDLKINHVHLSLDLAKEIVNLEEVNNIDINELKKKIPNDVSSYHLYAFNHIHEGDSLLSNVFIYCMPGYKCPIKERMLYSTCKGPLIDHIEKDISIAIDRKVEIDDPKEVSSSYLYDQLHPIKNVAKKQFDRPKPPGTRGPKRMTQNQDD